MFSGPAYPWRGEGSRDCLNFDLLEKNRVFVANLKSFGVCANFAFFFVFY